MPDSETERRREKPKNTMLGESNVGKTSIIRRFTEGQYKDSYISTIGIDSRSKTVPIGEERVRLQIWDTAGQERFRTITSAYYRGAMGIMLVYDVTSDKSFSNIGIWLETIKEYALPKVSKILVGNKKDSSRQEVSTTKAQKVAQSHEMLFRETSAKNNENIEEAFMELAKEIQTRRQKVKETTQYGIVLNNDSQDSKSNCC